MLNGHILQPIQQSRTVLPLGFKPHEAGLEIIGEPTKEEWLACGKFIKQSTESVHFWIGDWMLYGEVRWGYTYKEVAELMGFEVQTIKDDKWVAARIPLERRTKAVTFSHYKVVADMHDPEEQDHYLQTAIDKELSVAAFREYVNKQESVYEQNTKQSSSHEDNSSPTRSTPSSQTALQRNDQNLTTFQETKRLNEDLYENVKSLDFSSLAPKLREGLLEDLKRTAEKINSLYSFFMNYNETDE